MNKLLITFTCAIALLFSACEDSANPAKAETPDPEISDQTDDDKNSSSQDIPGQISSSEKPGTISSSSNMPWDTTYCDAPECNNHPDPVVDTNTTVEPDYKVWTYTQDSVPASKTILIGESIEFILIENASTGYQWVTGLQSYPDIQWETSTSYPTTDRVGASGTRTFKATFTEPGSYFIQLVYTRPWENIIQPGTDYQEYPQYTQSVQLQLEVVAR